MLTGQALVNEATGKMEEARDLYREAGERWADYGFVLEGGQAYLGLARCLLALGDRAGATPPLLEARTIFDRLGAAPLLNDVDGYPADPNLSSDDLSKQGRGQP